MDTAEQLQKIKEECERMLEFSERANVTNYLKTIGRPEAGWKSTIAAIEYLSNDAEIFGENTQKGQAARSQIDAILAAWSTILL